MRRFEFNDVSSNKFWEIAVEGGSYTVRFGKLGTNGQVQTKTFASAAEARSEADRVIAEKTRKGYVEMGAVAPAFAEDVPVAPVVELEQARALLAAARMKAEPKPAELEWPWEFKAEILSRRVPGGPRTTLAPAPALRARVLEHWKRIEPQVRAGLGELTERRKEQGDQLISNEEQQALLDAMATPAAQEGLPPRLEGALFRHLEWEPEERENLVRWWLAEKGLAYALASMVALPRKFGPCRNHPTTRWLGPRAAEDAEAWKAIRRAATTASDEDYAAGLAVADELLDGGADGLALARIFAGHDRFIDAALEDRCDTELLPFVRTATQAMKVVKQIVDSRHLHTETSAVATMVDALGAEAVPALKVLLDHYIPGCESDYPSSINDVVVALSVIGTKEAFEALLLALESKKFSRKATEAFGSSTLGAVVLGRAATGRSGKAAMKALQTLAKTHRTMLGAARDELDADARALVESSLEAAAAPPPAAVNDGVPRRFEFVEGRSRKFWEVTLSGSSYSVRYGRIGTDGQAQEKSFKTSAAARKAYDRVVAEKIEKGYEELRSNVTALPKRAAPKPPPKGKEIKKVKDATDDAVRKLFEKGLPGVRVLELKDGELTDAGAFEVVLGARAWPDLERIELDGNDIGFAGLRALAVLGERVVPGWQSRDGMFGGFTIHEAFEPLGGDQQQELAQAWTAAYRGRKKALLATCGLPTRDLVGEELDESYDDGDDENYGLEADAGYGDDDDFDDGEEDFEDDDDGADDDSDDDAKEDGEKLTGVEARAGQALQRLRKQCLASEKEFLQALQGDFGNDYGIGFIALGDATAALSGTLLSAHDRGPIGVWQDDWMLTELAAEVDLANFGGVSPKKRPIVLPHPVPSPASLDDETLHKAWLASLSPTDQLFAALLFLRANEKNPDALAAELAGVSVKDGRFVGGPHEKTITAPANARYLLHLVTRGPDGHPAIAALRESVEVLDVDAGGRPLEEPFDAGALATLSNARVLRIDAARPANLEPLKTLTKLETLTITGPVDSVEFAPPGLKHLFLGTLAGLSGVGRLKKLSMFEFDGLIYDLGALSGLPLVWLRAGSYGDKKAVETIAKLGTLRALQIHVPNAYGYEALTALKNLEHLHIVGSGGLEKVELPALVSLQMPGGYRFGGQLPKLRFLSVPAADTLGELPALEWYEVSKKADTSGVTRGAKTGAAGRKSQAAFVETLRVEIASS